MRGHLLLLVLSALCPLFATAGQVQEYTIQKDQPVVHCWIYQDEHLGPVMEGPGCNKHLLPSCYQRMQEAMQAIDFVIRTVRFGSLLPEIAGRYIRENDTWLSTMRDCVKGE